MAAGGELYVCTWVYAESPDEESTYYQTRGHSSSEAFQAVYWRCVAVFFASSRRQQPEARHVLFTNVDTIPVVDGEDVGLFLERMGVEVVRLPLTYATPPGYYDAWRNQFYVLDIIRYLSTHVEPEDTALLLDSDCVWIANAGPIVQALRRDGVLPYVHHYAPDFQANRLTRKDMQDVAAKLMGASVSFPLLYCGGEFIASTGEQLPRLAAEIDLTWEGMMELHRRGELAFVEEGQTLSYIYHKLGYPIGTGNAFFRRIWTGSMGAHNTAMPDDHGLIIWHVPTEKRLGIRRLFAEAFRPGSELWSLPVEPELRRYLGRRLGVYRNPLPKQARDLVRRLVDRVRYR